MKILFFILFKRSTIWTFCDSILSTQIWVCCKCQNFAPIPWSLNTFSSLTPLRETERFGDEPLTDGIWTFCNLDEIVTELHFILNCPLYNDLRNSLLVTTLGTVNFSDNYLLKTLRCNFEISRQCAKFLFKASD